MAASVARFYVSPLPVSASGSGVSGALILAAPQLAGGRRSRISEWHQGEQETLAAIIEHRARRPLMGQGCRPAKRHRAPHPHRRPVDAPGRPPGAPGARTRARRRCVKRRQGRPGMRPGGNRRDHRQDTGWSTHGQATASMRPGANRRDHEHVVLADMLEHRQREHWAPATRLPTYTHSFRIHSCVTSRSVLILCRRRNGKPERASVNRKAKRWRPFRAYPKDGGVV